MYRKAFKQINNISIFNKDGFVVIYRFHVKFCDFNHTDTEIYLFTFLVVCSIRFRIHYFNIKMELINCAYSLGHSNYCGGHVPHRFSKVGSTEQIFFFKNYSLGNKFLPKLVCLELKFCQNLRN